MVPSRGIKSAYRGSFEAFHRIRDDRAVRTNLPETNIAVGCALRRGR
jgi:hypothetical protein